MTDTPDSQASGRSPALPGAPAAAAARTSSAIPPGTPRHTPAGSGGMPWVETREGGLFFVNALFLFPYLMVLVPLLTRIVVRGVVGGLPEPSVIVDTFPELFEYLAPRMGWLAVLPAWLTWKNLKLESRGLPRAALVFLLVTHLLLVGWTVTAWLGVHSGVLPGGPPAPVH